MERRRICCQDWSKMSIPHWSIGSQVELWCLKKCYWPISSPPLHALDYYQTFVQSGLPNYIHPWLVFNLQKKATHCLQVQYTMLHNLQYCQDTWSCSMLLPLLLSNLRKTLTSTNSKTFLNTKITTILTLTYQVCIALISNI